ncbi:uncharacterized protein LOC134182235 [Corticium candelabrum]|uniref:uncharacterized protein LOC134182235 n=1 Tax=Corticium candelabrum TaxID=121492 RepID=UPI002E266C46|nr:uncharacterized protein LOC134182235 [Corticium candelabrum]
MPRVTVTPSSSFVRNLYGSQIIACFAESLIYAPWVRWFKNADQRLGYSSITGSNYTITFPFTTTGINVTHYTCSAQNSVGIVTNASVSVVVRGLPGGWSWWTDNSLCSVSCGPSAGIRIRTRRCYNQNGCSGPAINASTCYSYKPCLSVETTTSAALTVKTTYTSDAVVTTETASTVTSLPTTTQKIKSPNKTISDTEDKSLSTAVIAVTCIIPTAIVTFVVTVAMMYYIFKRKDNDRDAPPERARNRQDVGKSDTRASAHDRYDSSVTFKNKKNDVKIERPQATNSEPSETVDFVEEEYYEEVEQVSGLHKRPFGKQTSSSARKPQASYEGSYKHPKPQASEGSYKHPKLQTSHEGGYKHPKPQTSYDKLSSNVRPSTKASTSVRYVNVPSQHSSQTQQQYEEDDFYVQPDGCAPDKRH